MTNIIKENLNKPRTNFKGIVPTPMLKETHELLAEAFARNSSLKTKLPQPFGVHVETVTAWARPKSSDINPTGTGKGNPLDRTEKLIEITHVTDPEMAREMSEHFVKFVDELDRMRGLTEAFEDKNMCAAIARVVESHAKFINLTIRGCENLNNATELLAKTLTMKSCVLQLEGCLKGFIQSEVENG